MKKVIQGGFIRNVLLVILFYSNVYSQGLNNLFMYGYFNNWRGHFDLKTGIPITSYDSLRLLNMNVTNANISDLSGNLLFYTNGVVICDRTDTIMQNGNAINPSIYTTNWTHYGLRLSQTHLIIPMPGDTSKYYLFHETIDDINAFEVHYSYYSIIDISLNGGLGKVIQKQILLLQDTLSVGNLTACKHANGRDWWLIIPEYGQPAYYIYLISPFGIQYFSKQTIGTRYYDGQVAFSLDGSHYGMYDFDTDIEIFDFDRCNGTFSNYRYVSINDSMFGIGFSFSPNSKIGYASAAHYIYQVNLDSTNLANSFQIVASWDSTYSPFPPIETGFIFSKLGPDGKIYVATSGTTQYMHVIDEPDSAGIACNVMQHSVFFGDSIFNWNSVPNHPNYFLGPVMSSICDSLGLGITETIYDKNLNLRINPNPAQGSFYVNYELPTGKDAVLYVYNAMGQKIHTQRIYSVNKYLQVHCDNWKAGVYFVKVVMDKDRFAANARVVVY